MIKNILDNINPCGGYVVDNKNKYSSVLYNFLKIKTEEGIDLVITNNNDIINDDSKNPIHFDVSKVFIGHEKKSIAGSYKKFFCCSLEEILGGKENLEYNDTVVVTSEFASDFQMMKLKGTELVTFENIFIAEYIKRGVCVFSHTSHELELVDSELKDDIEFKINKCSICGEEFHSVVYDGIEIETDKDFKTFYSVDKYGNDLIRVSKTDLVEIDINGSKIKIGNDEYVSDVNLGTCKTKIYKPCDVLKDLHTMRIEKINSLLSYFQTAFLISGKLETFTHNNSTHVDFKNQDGIMYFDSKIESFISSLKKELTRRDNAINFNHETYIAPVDLGLCEEKEHNIKNDGMLVSLFEHVFGEFKEGSIDNETFKTISNLKEENLIR